MNNYTKLEQAQMNELDNIDTLLDETKYKLKYELSLTEAQYEHACQIVFDLLEQIYFQVHKKEGK